MLRPNRCRDNSRLAGIGSARLGRLRFIFNDSNLHWLTQANSLSVAQLEHAEEQLVNRLAHSAQETDK